MEAKQTLLFRTYIEGERGPTLKFVKVHITITRSFKYMRINSVCSQLGFASVRLVPTKIFLLLFYIKSSALIVSFPHVCPIKVEWWCGSQGGHRRRRRHFVPPFYDCLGIEIEQCVTRKKKSFTTTWHVNFRLITIGNKKENDNDGDGDREKRELPNSLSVEKQYCSFGVEYF